MRGEEERGGERRREEHRVIREFIGMLLQILLQVFKQVTLLRALVQIESVHV